MNIAIITRYSVGHRRTRVASYCDTMLAVCPHGEAVAHLTEDDHHSEVMHIAAADALCEQMTEAGHAEYSRPRIVGQANQMTYVHLIEL